MIIRLAVLPAAALRSIVATYVVLLRHRDGELDVHGAVEPEREPRLGDADELAGLVDARRRPDRGADRVVVAELPHVDGDGRPGLSGRWRSRCRCACRGGATADDHAAAAGFGVPSNR